MPTVSFSKSDVLRGTTVEPAWYEIFINTVGEWKPTKDQKSNNLEMEGVIVRNADTGDTKFKDVPVTLRFNDQTSARGFIAAFLRGLGVEIGAETYELANAQGKTIVAMVKNDVYEGRIVNKVEGYRDPKTKQQASEASPVTT